MTFKKSTGYAGDRQRTFYGKYKIIIPKEEPMSYEEFRKNASNDLIRKFDTDCSKYSEDGHSDNYFYANCKYWENKLKEEPKQETLEEAAKDYIENTMRFSFNSMETKTQANRMLKCVEFGAKWQKERSYSEKEVFELLNAFNKHTLKLQELKLGNSFSVTDWFEQFKKK